MLEGTMLMDIHQDKGEIDLMETSKFSQMYSLHLVKIIHIQVS